jgi:hypothetical protein
MIDATPLKPGESYGTVADIRDCADLPELPFCPGERMQDGSYQPYWTRPDGSGIVVLLRAPSLAERREIETAAGDDVMAFVLETCLRCIKEPRFTREQLAILSAKNATPLIQISDKVWSYLAEFPAAVINRMVREIAGLPQEAPAEEKPAPKRTKKPAP